jgi:hypothetical protein
VSDYSGVRLVWNVRLVWSQTNPDYTVEEKEDSITVDIGIGERNLIYNSIDSKYDLISQPGYLLT